MGKLLINLAVCSIHFCLFTQFILFSLIVQTLYPICIVLVIENEKMFIIDSEDDCPDRDDADE